MLELFESSTVGDEFPRPPLFYDWICANPKVSSERSRETPISLSKRVSFYVDAAPAAAAATRAEGGTAAVASAASG